MTEKKLSKRQPLLCLISWSLYSKYDHFWKTESKKKKRRQLFQVNCGCFHKAWECNRCQVKPALCRVALCWALESLPFFSSRSCENLVFPALCEPRMWCCQRSWQRGLPCGHLARVWDTCVHPTGVLCCCCFLVILLMRKQLQKINGFKL